LEIKPTPSLSKERVVIRLPTPEGRDAIQYKTIHKFSTILINESVHLSPRLCNCKPHNIYKGAKKEKNIFAAPVLFKFGALGQCLVSLVVNPALGIQGHPEINSLKSRDVLNLYIIP
jgi:hypothetical protein